MDLSGQSAAAVDADGWTYAVDFPWLKMPPSPGSGRMCAAAVLSLPRREACVLWRRLNFKHFGAQTLFGSHGDAVCDDDRTVKDFVRRRRWIRTRVPVMHEGPVRQEGAPERPAAESSPAEPTAGEAGLVEGQSPIRLQEALSYPRHGILVCPQSVFPLEMAEELSCILFVLLLVLDLGFRTIGREVFALTLFGLANAVRS